MIVKVRASKYKAPRFLASLWWVPTTWQCGYGQSGCCMSVLSWLHLSQWVKVHPLSIFSCTGAPKFLRNQQSLNIWHPSLLCLALESLRKAAVHVPSHGIGIQPLWRNPTLWSSPFLAPCPAGLPLKDAERTGTHIILLPLLPLIPKHLN